MLDVDPQDSRFERRFGVVRGTRRQASLLLMITSERTNAQRSEFASEYFSDSPGPTSPLSIATGLGICELTDKFSLGIITNCQDRFPRTGAKHNPRDLQSGGTKMSVRRLADCQTLLSENECRRRPSALPVLSVPLKNFSIPLHAAAKRIEGDARSDHPRPRCRCLDASLKICSAHSSAWRRSAPSQRCNAGSRWLG